MSQTYDPDNSEQSSGAEGEQVYPSDPVAGPRQPGAQDYPGAQGYPHPQGYPAAQGYPGGQGYPTGQAYPGGPGYVTGAGWTGPSGDAGYGGGGYGGAGYVGGPVYGAGFASEPPPPPRHRWNHKRGLIATGAAALVAGAAAGVLISTTSPSSTGTATATSKTVLSTSQIAARVDPGLVDIVSTDGLEGATSAGTGIVLTSNGEILTNNHVIEGATSIKVTDIGNGRTYTAKVVGYDSTHDVAVIQLQNASGLTVASLGDSSSVSSGDTVVALGNAGGKGGTPSVASGKVTGLDQSIAASDELSGVSEQLTGLIETNADIQPGDSGGSLVNSYGQVIGMDTAASSGYSFQPQGGESQGGQSSGSQVQAYAIGIDSALSIAKQIEAGTTSSTVHIGATAFLGVGFSAQSSQSGSGGTGSSGATIAEAVSGSPAAKAGLVAGDEITSVGGASVSAAADVAHALIKYHPGDTIAITYTNTSGESQTANVTLATGPSA
jgi:S1-C subfamily serine protease